MKFVLLGPTGSGKGTQADLLNKKFDIPHIKIDNLIREQIRLETIPGKEMQRCLENNEPIPDPLITDIVLNYISQYCPSGFTLDGFPATVYQAEKLHEKFTIVAAIVLNVPEKEIIRRLTGLKVCPSCNRKYQIDHPPKYDNQCDVCNGKLIFIEDNSKENIKKKIKDYNHQMKAIISFYEKLGVLHAINGNGNYDDVFQEILHIA
ncbi:MAG TPA: nucleoside monophosphate kinase [Spirochaetota bacterium]|mgnify:FL=1|nr:nucleoside monophosphate kinase [Spirochaetota bacterium]